MFQIKNFVKNLLLILIGCILSVILVEIILRVYNPFEFRVKGHNIQLPINKQYSFHNNKIDKLDKNIIHRKNSLGFRGEEPPKDYDNYITILTIGGSTTECFYLSEGKTWPDILGKKLQEDFKQLWINNAGLDGHSTRGHIVLMENYVIRLKPKIVLFLTGINDQGRGDLLLPQDKRIVKGRLTLHSVQGFLISMGQYSEGFDLLLNIYRYVKALNKEMAHTGINFKERETIEIPEETKIRTLQEQEKYVKTYERRLEKLIRISKENGIIPVFITQPEICGNVIDEITNVDLSKIRIGNMDGELAWKRLELYNNATRRVGMRENILVIDLARELPKSSKYFYDLVHFTNEGAREVAEIIYDYLYPFLLKEYGEYEDTDLILSAL